MNSALGNRGFKNYSFILGIILKVIYRYIVVDVNDKGGKYCDFCPLKYKVKIVPKSVFPSLLYSELLEQQVGF